MAQSTSPATPATPAGICRALALGLAVAWAGWCCLAEHRAALAGYDGRGRSTAMPVSWRPGLPAVERLAACLDAARAAMAQVEGSGGSRIVAFSSPADAGNAGDIGGSAFFRSRWAAYLMPERDVLAWDDPHAPAAAGWVIAFRQDLSDLSDSRGPREPRLEPAGRWPGCRLYRVRR